VFKEFGHPYELLQIDGGYFRKMVDETGFQSAKILEKMAREVNISIASININYDVEFFLQINTNIFFSRNIRPILA